jgi:hypothetical protein
MPNVQLIERLTPEELLALLPEIRRAWAEEIARGYHPLVNLHLKWAIDEIVKNGLHGEDTVIKRFLRPDNLYTLRVTDIIGEDHLDKRFCLGKGTEMIENILGKDNYHEWCSSKGVYEARAVLDPSAVATNLGLQ